MSSVQINVDLPFQQLLETIRRLSSKEKLRINEVIWETETDIPMEQQAFVLERINSARQNPERLLDWDEVSKKLTS